MRVLFVHERFGAWAGAEANVLATAAELKRRGHVVGILHGPETGKGQPAWENSPSVVRTVLEGFSPDLAYVHKLADPGALAALTAAGVPVVRMVHDHDLCCMRSYKYFYLTRRIWLRI